MAARVRARESANQHLPILALTASALPDEAERCSQAGMDALLVKPTGLGELREALYRWMPAAAGERRQDEAPARTLSPIEALTELFGPSARLDELLDGFLSTAHEDLASFDEAVRTERLQAIAGCIHRINGAIKIFGAAELAEEGEHIRSALLEQQRIGAQEHPLQRYRQELARLIESLSRHRRELGNATDHATR
nr:MULTISPECIES: Hpt domain-containing protein [unclassified Dyella]